MVANVVSTSYKGEFGRVVPNILPPSETAGVSDASLGSAPSDSAGLATGRIQILVTGLLMNPSAVLSVTTLTTLSSPGCTA